MKAKGSESEFGHLNEESRAIWEANAEWWDDRIGDGNDFQDQLIEPASERLLEIAPGEVVLDVGCGAGRFARRLAALGAHVVAFDFSERFIARARKRTPPKLKTLEYHVIDATDKEQMLSLGSNRFDAAVATVCLMDLAAIEPLMGALREMLKSAGRFVFSVMHPCFHSAESCKFAEAVEEDGRFTVRRGVKVMRYLTPGVRKTEGIIGQPEAQYLFHRPLSVLLAAGFREGFVVDGLEEPRLEGTPDDRRPLRWESMPDIPPILVVRMRLASK